MSARRASSAALALVALALVALAMAAMVAEPVAAKVPGSVHCYRKVCHRVKTLSETERMVGRTLDLKTSYYDDPKVDRFNVGLLTSSGERFDAENAARAASSVFPDGTELLVWNPKNGRAAHVRVNDFGPFHSDRTLDITRALAERLGLIHRGVARLRVTVIAAPPPKEPRYRAFRTYPETRGYLGHYAENDIAFLAYDLVRDARSLNPPLPRRAPRLAGDATRAPAPASLRESLPKLREALQVRRPAETLHTVRAAPAASALVGVRDVIAAVAVPEGWMFGPPTPEQAAGARNRVDRLRFGAAVLSAPVPAAATLAGPGGEERAGQGPATAISYLLAGGMLAILSLLILVATRPMRKPVAATIITAAAAPSASATPAAARAAIPLQKTTLIGEGLSLVGDVVSNDDVIIEGRLEGNCHCRRLRVAAGGHVDGDVIAEELIVEGAVNGNVVAHAVRVEGHGMLVGEIRYVELAVGPHAEVNALCRLRPRGPLSLSGPDVREAA